MLAADVKILTLINATAKGQQQQPQYNNNNGINNNSPKVKLSNCNGNSHNSNRTHTPQRASKFNSNNNNAGHNKNAKKQQQQYTQQYYNIPTTTANGTLNRKKFYHHHQHHQHHHFNQNGRNKNSFTQNTHHNNNNNKAVKNQNFSNCTIMNGGDLVNVAATQTLQNASDNNNNYNTANNNKTLSTSRGDTDPPNVSNCCYKVVSTSPSPSSTDTAATAAAIVNGDLLKAVSDLSSSSSLPLASNCHKSNSNRLVGGRPSADSPKAALAAAALSVSSGSRANRCSISSTASTNSTSSLSSASSLTGSSGDLSREFIIVKGKHNGSGKSKKSYWKSFNAASNTNNSFANCNGNSTKPQNSAASPRHLQQSAGRQVEGVAAGAVVPITPKPVTVPGNQNGKPSADRAGNLPNSVSNDSGPSNDYPEHIAGGAIANTPAMTTALAAGTVSATAATTTANATATATTTAIPTTTTTDTTSTKSSTTTPATATNVVPPTSSSSLPPPPVKAATTKTAIVDPATETSTASVSTSTTPSPVNSPSSLAAASRASTATSSGPSSPNSYTLDFLHSVGVKMTGGANLTAPKTNLGNMRSTANYSNHSAGASPARNAYNFPNIATQRTHATQRFSGGGNGGASSGGGGSVGGQPHSHHYQQHHHNHHHQHHPHHQPQPQQLTIGSFIQKELLSDNFVSTGNRTGNNNGGGSAGGSGNGGNDYVSQQSYHNQQRYHNYYQPHYQSAQQQQPPSPTQHGYASLQHSYHSSLSGENVTRMVGGSGGSNSNTQRQHLYQNYHSNAGNQSAGAMQQHARNQPHNPHHQESSNAASGNSSVQHSKQPQQLATAKKSNYTSSSASSCSSSSSSSSSVSSVSSQTSYRQQKTKSASHLNLVIETLSTKSNMPAAHRSSHRQQHGHHHNNNSHQHNNHLQPNHHHQQHTATPTTPQLHQNIFNLTYVNTDALATLPPPAVVVSSAAASRGCSPTSLPSSAGTPSPQPDTATMLLGYEAHNHYQQQQSQQNFVSNKKLLAPLPMAMPTPTNSPMPTNAAVFCQQVPESSAVAAAISVTSLSTDSGHPSTPTPSATPSSNDYDDSDSSSTHSAVLPQGPVQHKYQQLKSMPLSASSSTSSSSSTAIHNCIAAQQSSSATAMPQLHSPNPNPPIEFAYNQHYQQPAQPHITSPQPQQHQPTHYRSNGVISLLNLPLNNNFSDEDLSALKQQSQAPHMHHQAQAQHFYFASGEHLNAAALPAGVANGGYWSPLQHSSFLYSQAAAATNILAAPSCSTTQATASLSPRLQERDEQQHQSSVSPCNSNVNAAEQQLLPLSHLKRSPSQQIGNVTLSQPAHTQRLAQPGTPGATGANVAAVAALRARNRGQPQPQTHHQPMAAPPPPPPVAHAYQQHNLLYGGAQPHLRPSTPSTHDFFAHTPPDRFLARAHLIEAKEAPAALLNNTKWDNLSQGIWNKFISSQQTEETFKQKMRLWRYLYIIIKNAYPRYGLYLVGSTISGFGADTSDVDMCLVSRSTSNIDPRMEALFNLTILRDCLSKSAEFENFNLIEAKVPILRFRDRIHQLEVDLNFNNCVGIKNTHLLYCYSQLDWRLRPLVLVTKLWAQYHNINNAKNMTISSYSLVLMVIHFLQYAVSPAVLPCLHGMFPEKFPLLRSNDFGYVDMTETIGPYESKNTQTLGELFLYFLEYYSCFDYTQFAISIRTGGLLPINQCRQAKSLKNDIHQWKELCIEEPFDLTNTARSVYDFETFERVKAVFVASWRILQETLDLNSIFTPIIIPPPSATNPALGTTNAAAQQYEDIGATTGDQPTKPTAINIASTVTAEVNAVSNATSTTIPTTTFRYINYNPSCKLAVRDKSHVLRKIESHFKLDWKNTIPSPYRYGTVLGIACDNRVVCVLVDPNVAWPNTFNAKVESYVR